MSEVRGAERPVISAEEARQTDPGQITNLVHVRDAVEGDGA